MTRIKRGYIARRRRKKISLFASSFRGAHSRLTRTITLPLDTYRNDKRLVSP